MNMNHDMKTRSNALIKEMRIRRSNEESEYAKPFFKWAGGKSQLLQKFSERLPDRLKTGDLTRYVEPFIGGGAVFFYIIQMFPMKEAIICDVNEELILTYQVIKKDVERLISRLNWYQEEYTGRDEQERPAFFYEIREQMNAEKEAFDFSEYRERWIERAAQLLFLNKTCFNGLFRVNSSGGFNVPFGKYKNPNVVHEKNLRNVSALLTNTTILLGDFNKCLEYIDNNTFLYIDPPYRPLNKSSSFTSYAKEGFSDEDQKRLSEFFAEADRKGAAIMLSNSDPKNEDPDDQFFDDLYHEYRIERVGAKRFINCDAEKRGEINELIVMNYPA